MILIADDRFEKCELLCHRVERKRVEPWNRGSVRLLGVSCFQPNHFAVEVFLFPFVQNHKFTAPPCVLNHGVKYLPPLVALSNRAPKHGVTRLVSHGARKQRMQQRALVLSLQRPWTCRLWPLPVLLLLKLRNDCRGAGGRRVSPSAKHRYLRFVQSHRRALLPYESFTPHLPSAAAGATSDRETKRLLARAA